MKRYFFNCACLIALYANAQTADTAATKSLLATLNQSLDEAVVHKRSSFLQTHYAPDFYFLHGTGQIDSKESWLKTVLDTATHYHSRRHDSVRVELHNDVAIVTGILTVKRPAQKRMNGYVLRYIRVYALRNQVWQLLSHRTLHEQHLPDENP